MMDALTSEYGIVVSGQHRYARWYDDGPDSTRFDGSDPADVERVYRDGFIKGVREASAWDEPEDDEVEGAWKDRQAAFKRATVQLEVPPGSGSTQPLYKLGHTVEAARTRGRHQALATANAGWRHLDNHGVCHAIVTTTLLPTWREEIKRWAKAPNDEGAVSCPPRLEEIDASEQALQEAADEFAPAPLWLSAGQLLDGHPELRAPVIDRLLREGETMNVIAPPKTGKSWLVNDLAIAVATGRPWLGRYETVRGDVLIIDNELHAETSANRIPKVAKARNVPLSEIAGTLHVCNLRGSLKDLDSLAPILETIEPGRFKVIVLDAWYRFLPADTDENDNGTMARLYNRLDLHAQRLGCCFVLIHHSTKGNQSTKAITDVGAGAGAQSRATDTHLVLRQHEETDAVVLDAAVRSWPPIEPVCLRWAFPVWEIDDELDPSQLARPSGRRRKQAGEPKEPKAKPEPWTPERFVQEFVRDEPQLRDEIILAAEGAELSKAKATSLLRIAETKDLLHRWQQGHSNPVRFSTEPQPLIETEAG